MSDGIRVPGAWWSCSVWECPPCEFSVFFCSRQQRGVGRSHRRTETADWIICCSGMLASMTKAPWTSTSPSCTWLVASLA